VNSQTLIQTDGYGAVGSLIRAEIFQQPDLWPDTLGRVVEIVDRCDLFPCDSGAVITGAGSSAYAARAIEAAWPGARAVPSTDLLVNAHPYFGTDTILVSLARSGESPESAAVVRNIQRLFPRVRHLAITCNAEGHLARLSGASAIILDPRTNDRSLAMTSSFSNLVLAGICLKHAREVADLLPRLCARLRQNLPVLNASRRFVSAMPFATTIVAFAKSHAAQRVISTRRTGPVAGSMRFAESISISNP
jgi:tagatose-6-phosphate ketose/aldose isomerase